ncbi:MAG: HAD family hydrolase [Lachnospiraceae bacterium]|nr:HAD family hydrolase [Lachnospiraceae bacterium]
MQNLIFDIDGTLWNSTPVVATAWNRAVNEGPIEELKKHVITDKTLQKEFGKPMDVIADDLFGDIDPVVKADILKACCKYEHDALEENEKDLSYEGMKETMHKLESMYNLFIVSNCQDGYIELVMRKNGLTDIIKDYECFGHTGLQKDENILLICKRNNLDLKETVYIGDTLGDYEATKKAGLKFVFCKYGFGSVDTPDYAIDKFSDLIDLF